MNKLIAIEIGNLGTTITGKTPSSNNPEDFGSEYMFITPSDSFDNKMIFKTNRYLSDVGINKLKNKVLPPKSVLVSCIGSAMGKIIMNHSSAISNQQINSIIINRSFDSDYIYYNLKNNYKLLRNAAAGSTALPMLNKTDFDKLVINIHKDLKDQRKIASVLSALDSKIEVNNRINTELEAMAKTLYDYWFVQFDFPDKNGKPYKTSGGKMVWNEELKREIPEGWDSGVLSDLGEIIGGSTPSRDVEENFDTNGTPWITPKDLSENTGNKFITKGEVSVSDLGLKSASLKILPKGSVLMSSRAPVGYMAIARESVTTNQGFKSFVPKSDYSTSFIFYTVKNAMPEIINNASGSTFKEISGSTLKIIKVCLPKNIVIKEYTSKVEAIFDRQNNLEIENQKLTELRDWLLPMLMNGQVKVN
jgi:type I restriction enzyme, S subunit